jgi:para-nitrobenzyl esterase
LSDALIEIPTGKVQGRIENGVAVWRGVPFAKPPIGDLRFKPPQKAEPWTGVLHAKAFGPTALQNGSDTPRKMSEDCLYLNIWAPRSAGPYPVMLWLHGGANIAGSASDWPHDGWPFARDGVVCVTANYRLGALGFMELGDILGPDYAGSGANGMRDQLLALEWVYENIAAFNGDPDCIYLAGESAGAKNAAALLASPLRTVKVTGAIMESGGGQTTYTMEEAQGVANLFLDSTGLTRDMASTLLHMPADALMSAQARLYNAYDRRYPFRAVIDGQMLTQRPLDAIAAGAGAGVRSLIGSNADETRLYSIPGGDTPLTALFLAHAEPDIFAAVLEKYPAFMPELSLAESRYRAYTAEEYWIPSLRIAEAQAQRGDEVYVYRFDMPMRAGPNKGYAVHASELSYVWDRSDAEPKLATQMHGAWCAFMKGLAPGELNVPVWPRYDLAARPTMLFNATNSVENDPRGAERALWDGVL